MTSRNVKYGSGKKHLKSLFLGKKHLKNWNPRFGHSNNRMEALGKRHICLLDPNTMVVPLTNLNLWRESVWCGLKCNLDAFLSSVLPQILLRWQNIRQILVDQKNLKKRKTKNEKSIEIVVCGFSFRFFWAISHKKWFSGWIGKRKYIYFFPVQVSSACI